MRRTRGFAWYHVLFAVPALALAFGVQYFMKKNGSTNPEADLTAGVKPSLFHGTDSQAASASKTDVAKLGVEKVSEGAEKEEEEELVDDSNIERIDHKAQALKKAREMSRPGTAEKILDRSTASVPNGGMNVGLNINSSTGSSGECLSVEYRGDAPAALTQTDLSSKLAHEDWDRVILLFARVKNELGAWLSQHRKGFPEKTVAFMEKQLDLMHLRRPPIAEQPDLAWRGIGAFVMEGKNPAIHLGMGFMKLARYQPERARFELTRLVAQSWSPCEVQAWAPLLSCLGVADSQACSVGSTSEAGWAVSSALAAIVAPPGCIVPAFKEQKAAQCLKHVPAHLSVTNSFEYNREPVGSQLATARVQAGY